MLLIDLTVPLDWNSPVSPVSGHILFLLKPINRIARGGADGARPLVVLHKS